MSKKISCYFRIWVPSWNRYSADSSKYQWYRVQR